MSNPFNEMPASKTTSANMAKRAAAIGGGLRRDFDCYEESAPVAEEAIGRVHRRNTNGQACCPDRETSPANPFKSLFSALLCPGGGSAPFSSFLDHVVATCEIDKRQEAEKHLAIAQGDLNGAFMFLDAWIKQFDGQPLGSVSLEVVRLYEMTKRFLQEKRSHENR